MIKYILLENKSKLIPISYVKMAHKSDEGHTLLKLTEVFNKINASNEFTIDISFEEYVQFIESDNKILRVNY